MGKIAQKPKETQAEISEALGALRSARANVRHCPSSDNIRTRDLCQQHLNDLLDRYPNNDSN